MMRRTCQAEATPRREAGRRVAGSLTMVAASPRGLWAILSGVVVESAVLNMPVPPAQANLATSPVVSGPTFSKPLSTPDPVPEAGVARAAELMRSGALFRYTPGVLSETALAEEAIVEYTGFKYCVGFNSCGSALFIALKCLGVQPGEVVLANAFSFTAVPSAIHHAGAVPAYVEATDAYVLDLDDLRKQITPETKYMMLTHMRGKVTNMQEVHEIAREHGIRVVEDCAHALGVQWDGVQVGREAAVACFSTQSAKVINAGEGGFLCTDDEEVAARAACYAGCYEQLYNQHLVAPPAEVLVRSSSCSSSSSSSSP